MAVSNFGHPNLIPLSPHFNNHNSEPMAVGSPSSNAAQQPGSQFLPGFLMGDSHAVCTTNFQSPAPAKSPPTQQARFMQAHLSSLNPLLSMDRGVRRHASPPTRSLWSTANHSRVQESEDIISDAAVPQKGLLNSPRSSLAPQTPRLIGSSPQIGSPFQMSDSNKSGWSSLPDDESATWITVFGYPSAQASLILQQFSHFGSIQKYLITNDGNWMHIKYMNKIQAKCALNKNGRVFPGNIMIGVRRCTDTEAMRSSSVATSTSAQLDTSSRVLPINDNMVPVRSFAPKFDSSVLPENSPGISSRRLNVSAVLPDISHSQYNSFGGGLPPLQKHTSGLARHSSMRPLAGSGAYRPPRVPVSRSTQGQPFRNGSSGDSGLVSKALDYVFGWN